MKNLLLGLNNDTRKIFEGIGQLADQKGLNAYVVGGFVRDLFLKRENLDIDIVIEGDGILFAKAWLAGENIKAVFYPQFGTCSAFLKKDLRIDFSSARKEYYVHAGALPQVKTGSIYDDLYRRDFTINAMAVRINGDEFGELVDFFKGKEDLEKKTIRILHEKSFIDDPTRILRAIRYEQRLNFQIELKTLKFLKSALQHKQEQNVKGPRYFEEFKKILNENCCIECLERLQKLNGLRFLGIDYRADIKYLKRFRANVNVMKRKSLYKNFNQWWLMYCMALFKKLNAKIIEDLTQRFQLSRKVRKNIFEMGKIGAIESKLSKEKVSPSEIYRLLNPLAYETVLFIRANSFQRVINFKIDKYLSRYQFCRLEISGNDLQKIGVPDGRNMAFLLKELLYQKLDGKVLTRHQELFRAKEMGRFYKA